MFQSQRSTDPSAGNPCLLGIAGARIICRIRLGFFHRKSGLYSDLSSFIWARVLESAAAADTVLRCEKEISLQFSADQKYAFEERNGKLVKQYSTAYAMAYENSLDHMIERRMRQSIFARRILLVYRLGKCRSAFTRPAIERYSLSVAEQKEFEILNLEWKNGACKGRDCN